MMRVRPYESADWPALWCVIRPVFRAGETYAYAPDISEADARAVWVEAPAATWVAVDDAGAVVGTYYLKPNQPTLGAHVCNCGYIVAEQARGQGIASALCEHSQEEARRQGFLAMQYNLVVSMNTSAVRLWKRHGFELVGTLPGAFRHPRQGLVDAHIMYKWLG